MTTATAVETELAARERSVIRRYRQASAVLSRQEAEAAARLAQVDNEFAAQQSDIDGRFQRAQALVSETRAALVSVELGDLVPASLAPARSSLSARDLDTYIANAAQTTRSVHELVSERSRMIADTRVPLPSGITIVGVIDLGASLIGIILGFMYVGNSSLALMGLLLLLLGTAFGVAGIGLLMKQEWARVTNVVLYAICGLIGITTIITPILAIWIIIYLFTKKIRALFGAGLLGNRQALAELAGQITRMGSLARGWHESTTRDARATYERKRADVVAYNERELTQANRDYQATLATLRAEVRQVNEDAGAVNADWADSRWGTWEPMFDDTGAPPPARMGTFTRVADGAAAHHEALVPSPGVTMPAFVPLLTSQQPILFRATGPAKATAIGAIQSMLLHLLFALPAGKVRFTFLDPIGLGQNVASFMQLGDDDENLISGKAWTDPQHIEQQLANLTEHMENVIQKYLRNKYASIEDYNRDVKEVAEPYRILVALDFPNNMSEASARRLVSIATNGPRCGVYAIVLHDTALAAPYGVNVADLENAATVFAWDGQRFIWQKDGKQQDADFGDCVLTFDAPPDGTATEHLLKVAGRAAVEASKVEVPYSNIMPQRPEWWHGDSHDGIFVPLGPTGRKKQMLDLGKGTEQHVLVVGRTGSGKSSLLHTLITTLALTYPPQELELYLIDFKKGVEFKTYVTHKLPHVRVVAIESEREYGLSVLEGLDREATRRSDLFKSEGEGDISDLGDYRTKTHKALPRVLLLVDEFQEFFTQDDMVATRSAQILDRLVRQGRGFGIHVLLGSQTLAGAYTLARSTIDQMAVRIALQCSDADSRLILADDNPAARLLTRPGEAIYNARNGFAEGNNRFQVAWLPDDERDQYLTEIIERKTDYRPPWQRFFDGNAAVELEEDGFLGHMIAAPDWPTVTGAPRAWLGEPVAITDEPVGAPLRQQSGSNMLFVTQNEESALALLTAALLSIAAQTPVGRAQQGPAPRFYIADYTMTDGPYTNYFEALQQYLPHRLTVLHRRQVTQIVSELAAEAQKRLDEQEDGRTTAPAAPIYLFIHGLHRARDLRPDDSVGGYASYAFSGEGKPEPSASEHFTQLLRDGPEMRMHTLVWCDTATNLNRSLDTRAMREFALRAVGQMSAEDSTRLVDSPAASQLGPFRALFVNEDEGVPAKFRPYALPTKAWLEWARDHFAAKA